MSLFNRFSKKNDEAYLESLQKLISSEPIQARLSVLLEWYTVSARNCQSKCFAAQMIGILIPAVILVLNAADFLFMGQEQLLHLLVAVLSSAATLTAGIMALTNWQENWIRYRASAEQLKSEAAKYVCSVGEYMDQVERDAIFVSRMEQIASNEHSNWRSLEQGNGRASGQQVNENGYEAQADMAEETATA